MDPMPGKRKGGSYNSTVFVAGVHVWSPKLAFLAHEHLRASWFVAATVTTLLVGQLALMTRLLRDPLAHTPWYNATGTSLYVLGMLASALGLGGVLGL